MDEPDDGTVPPTPPGVKDDDEPAGWTSAVYGLADFVCRAVNQHLPDDDDAVRSGDAGYVVTAALSVALARALASTQLRTYGRPPTPDELREGLQSLPWDALALESAASLARTVANAVARRAERTP